jgi:hypothetical protein
MVTGQDQDIVRCDALKCAEVMMDGVGRAAIRSLPGTRWRRHRAHIFTELFPEKRPASSEMTLEYARLIPREDQDLTDGWVEAVTQGKIDQAVGTDSWRPRYRVTSTQLGGKPNSFNTASPAPIAPTQMGSNHPQVG